VRLARALRALTPRAVVLTGQPLSLEPIGRIVYTVRRTVPGVAVFDHRGAVPDTGASTVHRLGERPLAARDALVAWLAAASRGGPELSAAERSPAPARGSAAGA
jgi:hypothetical protein